MKYRNKKSVTNTEVLFTREQWHREKMRDWRADGLVLFMTDEQRAQVGELRTSHHTMKKFTGVCRPGKTARDRSRKFLREHNIRVIHF